MKQVIEGSHAISEAVRLARVKVISAYPITPQTHIVEALSEYCAEGLLKAEFICVESEHSAMAAVIAASAAGVRAFTATSSHGLALMHELLHWASAARLPIVMAEVNRALGPGWNIWMDQTDSLSQRDTGWIQLYNEDSQEALDTTLMAFRLAETVNIPVMSVIDAFFLSHTYEPVDIPDQTDVDSFLPDFVPTIDINSIPAANYYQMAPPGCYMEMRHNLALAMETVQHQFEVIENEHYRCFGRKYGMVEPIACQDAETIIVSSGTATGIVREFIQEQREQGEKIGGLKIKLFRPFPSALIRQHLSHARRIAVIDRNYSAGVGGIFAQEIKAALYRADQRPLVLGYIAGLGGRDITRETIAEIYRLTKNADVSSPETQWVGLNS